MYNNLPQQEISMSAKKMKKELDANSPTHTLTHQQLIDLIKKSLKNSSNTFNSSNDVSQSVSSSLINLSKIKDSISKEVFEATGILINNVSFIDFQIKKKRELLNENFYSYNLAQYIQDYEIFTGNKIFDDYIETFEDAYNNTDRFAKEIVRKYEKMSDYKQAKFLNKTLTSDVVLAERELFMLLRKKEHGVSLSKCDELFEESIKMILENKQSTYDIDEKITISMLSDMFKQEIVRLRCLIERKTNYSSFITEIQSYYYETESDTELKEINKITEKIIDEKVYLGVKSDCSFTNDFEDVDFLNGTLTLPKKKKPSFFNRFSKKKTDLYLNDSDYTEGIYLSGTIGSGSAETFLPFLGQAWLKNETSVVFDAYNDLALVNKLSNLKRLTSKEKDLVFINDQEFLELSKEELTSIIKKGKSIVFYLGALYKMDLENINKRASKTQMIIDLIGSMEKKKPCNIVINSVQELFHRNSVYGESFLSSFHEKKKTYKETKFLIKGTLSADKAFLEGFDTHIIMKTECDKNLDIFKMDGFDSLIELRRNIVNLSPGEFVLIKNKIFHSNEPVYTHHYYNQGFNSNSLVLDGNI